MFLTLPPVQCWVSTSFRLQLPLPILMFHNTAITHWSRRDHEQGVMHVREKKPWQGLGHGGGLPGGSAGAAVWGSGWSPAGPGGQSLWHPGRTTSCRTGGRLEPGTWGSGSRQWMAALSPACSFSCRVQLLLTTHHGDPPHPAVL